MPSLYLETFKQAITPKPLLTLTQWSDKYRKLPSSTSAEGGNYRSSRTPYVREIQDKLSPTDYETEEIIVVKAAQLGFSEILNNFVLFIAHWAPAPILYVLGSLDLARRVSRQRLNPAIELVEGLKDKFPKPRANNGTNTTLEREFESGYLLLVGSNSTASLRQYSARYAILDEVDSFSTDSVEGDPVQLAKARTTAFANRRKIVQVSTPTDSDQSKIWPAYLKTDQRKYHVPCPHCGHKQELIFKQLKWTDKDPDSAQYQCSECSTLIDESHKSWMLEQGTWIPTAESERRGLVGYHLNALYSPFISWAKLATQFLESKGDQAALQVFVNTVLGEPWERESLKVDADSLLARREIYHAEIPKEVLVLTAGVDVQVNRLEVLIVGHKEGNEAWIIDRHIIYGDPKTTKPWYDLDLLLAQTFKHENGAQMQIAATAIDTGYASQEVYNYVKSRKQFRIFAIKGVGGFQRPIVSPPSRQNIDKSGQQIDLFPIAPDVLKMQLMSMLRTKEVGAGYLHIPLDPKFDQDFIDSLTAEHLKTVYNAGKSRKVWMKKNPAIRNEVMDCFNYAFAALKLLGNINWKAWSDALSKKTALNAEGQPTIITKTITKPRVIIKNRLA